MGKINGDVFFEVAHTFHPDIKIIVSSVYPLEEQHELIQGADDYYDKSESLGVLLSKIAKTLSHRPKESPKKTILVIDDDQKVRFIYHEILSNAGYVTIEVPDSEKVFDFLKKQIKNIDLIILDLIMPKIMGIDFFEVIKEKYPDAKVIISSNYAVDEQEALVFTADGYFDKSEGTQALKEKVEKVLSV
jgi:CheY-like chemotaxis protein